MQRNSAALSILLVLFSFPVACGSSVETPATMLVLVPERTANPFGAYLQEILVAEGIRNFEVRNALDNTDYSAILVTEGEWSDGDQDLLLQYVEDGGSLVAVRPPAEVLHELGIEGIDSGLEDGYWTFDGSESSLPLQFKGPAARWVLGSRGDQVASLVASAPGGQPLGPAVARISRGAGQLLLFAFDPVRTVVMLRQGDPAKANRELDGIDGIRPQEMMQEGFWDPRLVGIPQTDLLQRFLVDQLRKMLDLPLPSFWYFPGDTRSVLVMTGDAHRDAPETIEGMLRDVESYGGTASIYLLPPVAEKWSREQVEAWQARGHEISVHPDHHRTEEHTRQNRWEALSGAVRDFREAYGIPVRTVRNDWVTWYGWVEQAQMQAELGIQMDLNYVSSVPTHFGYMFGSGLPMRFIDAEGAILDHYQQPTQFEDDAVMDPSASWSLRLTTESATRQTVDMIEKSLGGFFNSVCLNIHPEYFKRYSGDWTRNTLQFAASNGIPILSAQEWLGFVMARNATRISSFSWDGEKAIFEVLNPNGGRQLVLLIPARVGERRLQKVDNAGTEVEWSSWEIRGQHFARIFLSAAPSTELVAHFR